MTSIVRSEPMALTSTNANPWLDTELYPFSPRTLRTSDGMISYLDEGTGPTIVFVHGTPSWSFEWREQIRVLRTSFRCIAIDHLGFGLSDKPNQESVGLKPEDHARRLTTLLDKLHLENVTLVVHDFGGPIGIEWALERSHLVRHVVVMNTWMWAHGTTPSIARVSRIVRSWVGRWMYRWLNFSPRFLVPMSFGERSRLTARMHAQYIAPFGKRRDRMAPWVLGCELAGSDSFYDTLWTRRERLSRMPMTIIWGNKDPAFGADYLARWQNAFPHAHTHVMDGAGHFPQEEAPERVTAIIESAALASHTRI